MPLRQRSKRRSDLIGYLLIIVSIVIALSILIFYFIEIKNRVDINPETLCPKSGPNGRTVILFDKTDFLNDTQKDYFKIRIIDQIKSEIPKHHSLAVYIVSNDLIKAKKPLLIKCNPGTIKDIKDSFKKYASNPKIIQDKWNKEFSEEIDKVIDDLLIDTAKPFSPIMEMIQKVSINAFSNLKSSENKLILFSDMIHNTNELSFYKTIPSFKQFSKTSYFSKIRTDLEKNVSVEICQVRRDNNEYIQNSKEFKIFWTQYLVNGLRAKRDLKYYDCEG